MIRLYTIAEYAKKSGLTRVAIWQQVKAKKLMALKVAPKLYLIAK